MTIYNLQHWIFDIVLVTSLSMLSATSRPAVLISLSYVGFIARSAVYLVEVLLADSVLVSTYSS